mmetsp:Transcript_49551/g.120261  ORF Transcript_49551/g.120261 Transcript_49551/m.120261 type:complete len:94 (+) Transcript_49551:158-439(+)
MDQKEERSSGTDVKSESAGISIWSRQQQSSNRFSIDIPLQRVQAPPESIAQSTFVASRTHCDFCNNASSICTLPPKSLGRWPSYAININYCLF